MSLSIYKTEMHHLADVSAEEEEVIESFIHHADDGTYYLEQETLEIIKDRITPELYKDLKKEFDENDDFNFILS